MARTVWYSDGTHLNTEHYVEFCLFGKIRRDDYLEAVPKEEQQPARYLSSKAMVVGRIEQASSHYRRVKQHVTRLKVEATHTSGNKNFTFTIKYRVEGSTEVTTVQRSVVLKPGQKKRISLFVPVGNWATIDSVTAIQNRPHPAPPPAPPVFIAPVPVPKPVPVPAPPSNPRRPRR